MYIIELLAKFLTNKNTQNHLKNLEEKDYHNVCKHIFLPVDSTGETLACSKCGMIVKNNDLLVIPKNPFTM